MKNKRNRQQDIITILENIHFATVDELCVRLNASISTIRRDLDELHKTSVVRRVNGGSFYLEKKHTIMKENPEEEIPFFDEKQRIATAAISLIHEGDTIFMDGGTTNLQIANKLVEFSNITIVTNSIDIAYKFRNRKDLSMYICGGTMGEARPGTSIVGPLAEKMISLFRANICFLGTLGIHAKKGITDPDLSSARMKNIMIENSSKVVLVTDHSKFGKLNTAFVCPVDHFDQIITDKLAPKEDIDYLFSLGINVELV
ncbi:DeoR/GlpR family DNA-binding transcription regulator [Paenibacillus filicis]|uniref:DeoR/GlpR family DNA-binding transcription regulator n=1 Tax=Paenibacillus gyeongsangnamensis TaxID=3388067 RepID=A0ABT4QFC8_9BACL|nr:DeoR/GlpR family DNA-binding transcription regulator [Paenibacillus filicis]MCZ8515451.1 DeoR/GlpR family DNA-binding transcription regulator [Paenibacillus filicis]